MTLGNGRQRGGVMYGTYQNWGFRSSPFDSGPLPPTEEGAKLRIGRTAEVQQITRRLLTRGKIVTVEGSNGIGKTSVNNVASYLACSSYLIGEMGQMLVRCEKTFSSRKTVISTHLWARYIFSCG